jgi:hypothetical protein
MSMKAQELIHRRVDVAENAFADVVVWQVSQPVPGSVHGFKYRLAFVVDGVCCATTTKRARAITGMLAMRSRLMCFRPPAS